VTAPVRTIVYGEGDAGGHLASRTLRSLARAGLSAEDAGTDARALGAALASASDAVWVVRGGAWLARPGPVAFPPPSRTGRPLCALGAIVPRADAAGADEDAGRWTETLAATGGDLDGKRLSPLPPLASIFLEPPLARLLGAGVRSGAPVDAALDAALRALPATAAAGPRSACRRASRSAAYRA